jgi:very-short-patch-repair endonuclease
MVHQIVIHICGFQPRQLFIEKTVERGGAADHVLREFCRDMDLLADAVALQNRAERGFAAGVDIGGVSADIVMNDKFVIECDGVQDNVKTNIKPMRKLAILERCGFKVCRFSYREWLQSQEACVNRMTNYL